MTSETPHVYPTPEMDLLAKAFRRLAETAYKESETCSLQRDKDGVNYHLGRNSAFCQMADLLGYLPSSPKS